MDPPTKMKGIIIPSNHNQANPAPASSLLLSLNIPIPLSSPNETLIKVHAAAISPYELTWGATYTSSPPNVPRIPCFDFAGTVVHSSSPSNFAVGTKVFGLADLLKQGVLAEFAAVDTKLAAPMPKNLSFVEAASLPRAALTAWQAFFVQPAGERRLKVGQNVLITGASGAVGRAAVQLARWAVGGGGKIVAQGGAGIDALKGLGADVAVSYRDENGWENVVKIESENIGFDFVLDCVGGLTLEHCLRLVKDGGQLITIGSSPVPAPWNLSNVKGSEETRERGAEAKFFIVVEDGVHLSEIGKLVEEGVLKTSVSMVVEGLTEEGVREGWGRAEKGGLSGSVVVEVKYE